MTKKITNIVFYLALMVLMIFVIKTMLGDGVYHALAQIKTMGVGFGFLILLLAGLYSCFEGLIVWLIARNVKAGFTMADGIFGGFYMAIFRALTFGTATVPALIYYLNKKDIDVEVGYGIATVNYSFHKISIALYVTIGLIFNFSFFAENYGEYFIYILIGYVLTVIIVVFLLAVCLSGRAHHLVMVILEKIFKDAKFKSGLVTAQKKLNALRNSTGSILKNKKDTTKIIFAQLIKITFWFLIPYVTLNGMDTSIQLSVMHTLSVMGLVVALVGVIPTPGNVASIEIIFTLMFTVLVGETNAGAAMIVYRVATYYGAFLVAVGICFFARKYICRDWGNKKTQNVTTQ